MAERVVGVRVSIFRFVGDEPQPGLAQCELVDAHGRRWTFTEKNAIVSQDYLAAQSVYPQPGSIICRLVGRHSDPSGREVIAIECLPDDVDSIGDSTSLDVFPESLVEWEWGSQVERPWDGRAWPA